MPVLHDGKLINRLSLKPKQFLSCSNEMFELESFRVAGKF